MFSLEKHYALHNEQIYQFIYFLTYDKQLAEDLMQETFIRAHLGAHTYKADSSILTWLRAIAKNCTFDYLKKKSVRHFLPFGDLPEPKEFQLSAEDLAHIEEDKRALYIAISKLKFEHRAAIVLRKIEELSIKETAQILGWNESKVKNNTERGMKKLQEIMMGGIQDGQSVEKSQGTA